MKWDHRADDQAITEGRKAFLERKQHEKSVRSSILIQAIVVAVALLVVVIVIMLCTPGYLTGLREIFRTGPGTDVPKKFELSDHSRRRSADPEGSVQTSASGAMNSREGAEETVYCWTDKNGVRNFSNRPPPAHVREFETRKMASANRDAKETKVLIKANQVLVPVSLSYKGKEVSTYMLLDTGASTTMLNRKIADLLNIKSSRRSYGRLADGRSVRVDSVDLDYIVVGPNRVPNFATRIMDHQGNPEPFDGLLGMNFLREVNYHVDFKRAVISWARFE